MARSIEKSLAPGALARAGRSFLELYPRGFSLFRIAPLSVALVVLPEFLQHVVEIRLGMFNSRDAFRAFQWDPTRMALGYVKIPGLILSFLAAARVWWTLDNGGRWWDLRQLAWEGTLVGALLFFGVGSAPALLEERLPPVAYHGTNILVMIALLPALFILLAGLFGDRSTSLRQVYRSAWPWLLLTVALVIFAFAPAAWLHQMNHVWSVGAAPAVVWVIMVLDSALVGLLAGLTGTALYLGYAGFSGSRSRGRAEQI